jgi:cyclic pyranopterin monophosphate synthase
MSKKQFTHVSAEGKPQMVDVSGKEVTVRKAEAQAIVVPGSEILQHLSNGEITTKKGPVFQTAIIAGVMAAKKTSELIPFCHPVGLEDCQVDIRVEEDRILVHSSATVSGKTGVEMEALTAATVAALTIYDMCKALSHDIVIEEVKLMAKSGGKKDFKRNNA